MTAPPSEVALYVGPDALRVDVFDRYSIDVSMLEVGTAWTFSLWYSDQARAAWRLLTDPTRGLRLGQAVTVTIDGDAVLSGIVESRAVGDAEGGRAPPSFVISGRDALGPAATWGADPTLSLPGRSLEDVLTDLYRGVGIVPEVSASVLEQQRRTASTVARSRRAVWSRRVADLQDFASAGDLGAKDAVDRIRGSGPRPYGVTHVRHPRVGETVQAVVERIVRGLGYRVWTSPGQDPVRTAVIVDRPRTTGEVRLRLLRELVDGRVSYRGNVLSGRETTSIRDVPTQVTVLAHAPRGDAQAAMIARTVENGYLLTEAAAARVDPNTPPRPRYVESQQARTVAAAQAEAGRICAEANERFRVYDASVLGHRYEGLLWVPNNRVAVRDELLGMDETMLLVSASYEGARESAQTTRLTLLPEGALSEIPAEQT